MKIFHITHQYKIGGVEVAAMSSLEHLNSNLGEFKLVFIDQIDQDHLERIPLNLRPYIYSLQKRKWYDMIKVFYTLIKVIDSEKPDVIICSLWKSSMLVLFARLFCISKFKWVLFVHNTRFQHIVDYAFSVLASKFCDLVFTDSKAAGEFIKSYNNMPYKVVSFLLDFPSVPIMAKVLLTKNPRFVFTGRLAKQKRLDKCVSMINELKSNNINATFDIYGVDEGVLDSLKTEISVQNLEDRIFYKGTLRPDEVKSTISKYDFYLQLSDYEGMAITVVDAMQQGLVCVVTPVGAIEDYSKDMTSAIHYEGDSAEQMAKTIQKIKSVINSPTKYTEISESAIKNFSNYKTYKESILEHLKLIQI